MYVDQILYYARCENPEKDYLSQTSHLEDVVHDVLLKCTYLLQKDYDWDRRIRCYLSIRMRTASYSFQIVQNDKIFNLS